jgi:hypothetical protein
MDDLERRAKELDAEPEDNIYRKALQKDKWRELALEAIDRLAATQKRLDREELREKADIREWFERRG